MSLAGSSPWGSLAGAAGGGGSTGAQDWHSRQLALLQRANPALVSATNMDPLVATWIAGNSAAWTAPTVFGTLRVVSGAAGFRGLFSGHTELDVPGGTTARRVLYPCNLFIDQTFGFAFRISVDAVSTEARVGLLTLHGDNYAAEGRYFQIDPTSWKFAVRDAGGADQADSGVAFEAGQEHDVTCAIAADGTPTVWIDGVEFGPLVSSRGQVVEHILAVGGIGTQVNLRKAMFATSLTGVA